MLDAAPLELAPLFTDVCPAPLESVAHWVNASDGVRLRVGVWKPKAARGTVLLFPGRTEYIEKYAPTAGDLATRGFATISIDWRGQGLADRLMDDPRVGHVGSFSDYQRDVSAMIRAARVLEMPKPWFLLGHSMGGCIGLRAVMEGLPIAAAAFTGPMWGIRIAPHLRPLAWTLGRIMPAIGHGQRLAPGTKIDPYPLLEPFEGNMLTTDPKNWDMMGDQLRAHPELGLGGPSVTWLHEALEETTALAVRSAPDVPCITFLGSNERIVHVPRIHERMEGWKNGILEIVENGEHEVLMEDAETRNQIVDMMTARFQKAAG